MSNADHSQASSSTEYFAMRLLEARPSVSQRELAASLGVSLGKANYCVRALIRKGYVKTENYKNSRHKLAYLYLLTPSGVAAKARLTREFLRSKLQEFERLRQEIESLERECALSGRQRVLVFATPKPQLPERGRKSAAQSVR